MAEIIILAERGSTVLPPPKKKPDAKSKKKSSTAKAKALGTNRGAIERATKRARQSQCSEADGVR